MGGLKLSTAALLPLQGAMIDDTSEPHMGHLFLLVDRHPLFHTHAAQYVHHISVQGTGKFGNDDGSISRERVRSCRPTV